MSYTKEEIVEEVLKNIKSKQTIQTSRGWLKELVLKTIKLARE